MDLTSELMKYSETSPIAFLKCVGFEEVVFDRRAQFMCKFGCKNYARKYSCPPKSMQIQKKLKEYRYVVLFATTSEIPQGNSQWQTRALNRQKEYEIQRISAAIDNIFLMNAVKHITLGGGACKRCRKCSQQENNPCKKPHLKQVSMEASGIDCQRTMHNAGFDFEMPNKGSINRCGAVFFNDEILKGILVQKNISLQNYSFPDNGIAQRMCEKLLLEYSGFFHDIHIVPISDLDVSKNIMCNKCEIMGTNFACPPYSSRINLNMWKYAVIWNWRRNGTKKWSYNSALKTVHGAFYSLDNYFALSLRDCYCDECDICNYLNDNDPICVSRRLLAPSMQSQGIGVEAFGKGKFGIELL